MLDVGAEGPAPSVSRCNYLRIHHCRHRRRLRAGTLHQCDTGGDGTPTQSHSGPLLGGRTGPPQEGAGLRC